MAIEKGKGNKENGGQKKKPRKTGGELLGKEKPSVKKKKETIENKNLLLGQEGEDEILRAETKKPKSEEGQKLSDETLQLVAAHEELNKAFEKRVEDQDTDEQIIEKSALEDDEREQKKREETMLKEALKAENFYELRVALKSRPDLVDYAYSAQDGLMELMQNAKEDKVNIDDTIRSVLDSGDLFKSLTDIPGLKEKITELLKEEFLKEKK